MTPERWQQIERLYHAVLQRAQPERAAFLDAACADDAELRTEVDALLAAAAHGDTFLEASALHVTARALASELPRLTVGQRVGSYEILGDGTWSAGSPTTVVDGPYATEGVRDRRTYDVSTDGQRFLLIKQPANEPTAPQIIVVQHWLEELKRLVPPN